MKKFTLFVSLVFGSFAAVGQQPVTPNLMPAPKQLVLNTGKFRVTGKFTIHVQAVLTDTALYAAVNSAYQVLNRKTGLVFIQKYITPTDTLAATHMVITVQAKARPEIGVDESYKLQVTEGQVRLDAPTTAGALHGLETLIQLCARDES